MGSPPLILVCDHRGAGLAETLVPFSAAGIALAWSSQVRDTRARLAELQPAVIVLDPLAEGGKAEIEDIRRAQGGEAACALLLVTDASDPSAAVMAARAIEGGQVDLIHRGASAEEFLLRIERLCRAVEQRGEMADLRHRALHDDRTDLLRPKAFQQRIAEHFSAAERHHLEMALVIVDLDDFGNVNKDFDHTVGDLVIAKVGEVIRKTLRTEDIAGRLGGDEFAVLLPYTHKIDAARVVKRLRDEIQKLSSTLSSRASGIRVSASLGFETFDGTDLDSVETLRGHAEQALHEAKRLGGDRGVYFRSLNPGSAS